MRLTRDRFCSNGIFGKLTDDKGVFLAFTLEHAYQQPDGSWLPKVPSGAYTCIRGQHQLAGMSQPFTTFEVTGVSGHSGILFHVGNYNQDSEGCILLGAAFQFPMILQSKYAFSAFMQGLQGVDQFTLIVA